MSFEVAQVGINADEELVYEVWRHIDTNHNGQVSLFELFQAMKPSTTGADSSEPCEIPQACVSVYFVPSV